MFANNSRSRWFCLKDSVQAIRERIEIQLGLSLICVLKFTTSKYALRNGFEVKANNSSMIRRMTLPITSNMFEKY